MAQWLQNNIQNILIALGAAVVLFWPKIKEQLAALQQQPTQPAPEEGSPTHKHCCRCCALDADEDVPEAKRSSRVVTVMELREYCVRTRLLDGVGLCDQLATVIIKGKPSKVTVTREVEVG